VSQASPVQSPPRAGSPWVARRPDFEQVLGSAPRLERVAGVDAPEGPVYAADENALYFTTVPRAPSTPGRSAPHVSIKRLGLDDLQVSVVRADANVANGMALDREGRLVVCEQGTRSEAAAITRLDPATGKVTTLVDSWQGLPLSSPNDVVVKSDGTLWFTDPTYGFLQGFRPVPRGGNRVYRFDPRSDRLSVVADSFDKPNGLAFSPDERVLYVTDSGANQEPGSYYVDRPHHIKAFDVTGSGLAGERVLADVSPGFPDGLKVDAEGRLYASSSSGVQVFTPGGEPIGEISLPGAVNFAFGGRDRNVLYITADDAIWAAHLAATGPPRLKGA
jgi:gluconolactonase